MPAYYIPNGPANLASLFPTVIWEDVEEYFVEIKDAGFITIATTSHGWPGNTCCGEDKVRVFFMNALGTIDAINASWVSEEADIKSDRFQRPQTAPLSFSGGGAVRSNVRETRTRTLRVNQYPGTANDWLDQLFVSPNVWIEDRVNSNYLPVIVIDKKMVLKKEDDQFENTFDVEIYLANERIVQRN